MINKKIIILSHYLGGTGGVQVYNEQIAREFSKIGYEVHLIAISLQNKNAKKIIFENEPINFTYHLITTEDIFFTKPWVYFLKKRKITGLVNKIIDNILDLETKIIITNPIVSVFCEKYLQYNTNQIIGQFHGSVDYAMKQKGIFRIYRYLIDKYYRDIPFFSVLTKEDAEILKKDYHYSNAISITNPTRFEEEKMLTNVSKSKKIVYIGQIDKRKQLDQLIEAYVNIDPKIRKDWMLEIYGDGLDRKNLQKKLSQYNDLQIKYLGRTSNVREVFSKAAFTVLTSKNEGLPLTLIEAISVGLPVVSYNTCPGIREIVVNQKNGLLVEQDNIQDFTDAMINLITNSEKRSELAINAFDYSKKFKISNTIQQFENIFKRMEKENENN
ncbi:MAG: glycosyltransferase [Culicoidibacterales bacterium]